MEGTKTNFPKNFLWGASSSAFQIEGGWDEGGKGITVADVNSFKRSEIQADSKVASDFYHHWEEDIRLMKEMGMQIYRFSISWARIIPDGDGEINQEGIDFYHKIIDCLLEQGIQPFITLYHFDLPYALVKKYNGWESRECVKAFERYASVCFKAFGDKVTYWQVHNEQNLMFLAHALAVKACHSIIPDGKIGPAVSSTCTYPESNKPEDVWAARMNDWFKTDYCLDMHYYGRYPGYYMRYLEERKIVPVMEPEDEEILKDAKMDFIALNYYRTLCVRYLPTDEGHPAGERAFPINEVDFDQYGYFHHIKNEHLVSSEYGAQIDPLGLRTVLNSYYQKYHLPLIVTENGRAISQAIEDGVSVMGYSPWSFMDLLSSHEGFRKRYGFVYVNREDHDLKDLSRIKKDSYFWYKRVIETNGDEL